MILSLILGAATGAAIPTGGANELLVDTMAPSHAGEPILHPFVGFSIEFAWFPAFAGNSSSPNLFSNQLLDNLGEIQGAKPIIRVGGNTQDYATYDPELKTAINGTVIPSITTDYPRILSIGPSFFESYSTWPNTKFIHGFNLAENGTKGVEDLLSTVPVACEALKGKLAYWELGNEPNDYLTSPEGAHRPGNWTTQDYVHEWVTKSRLITQKLAQTCHHFVDAKYIAPSTGLPTSILNPVDIFQHDLGRDHNIALNSEHNYMGGATEPGVTLQKTLMNHTSITARVANHLDVLHTLRAKHLTNAPYIYGEMNSLYNQGRPGLSDSFGAALWGVDFNLYSASKGIRRSHMHQGSNYRYNAWQPEQTNRTTMGTKAPYYGNVMVAAMLAGRDEGDEIRVLDVPLDKETEGAYAAYVNGKLARIAVVNLQEFNYTRDAAKERPVKKYEFRIPGTGIQGRDLHLQRLLANGSNSISGVTWDGWSYNYELEGGKPVRLDNVTVGETVSVDKRGLVHFEVPDSSGAILNL